MTRDTVIVAAGSFSTSNTLGGHFRSASTIAELLLRNYKVILLNIGTRPSPVMSIKGQKSVFVQGSTAFPGKARSQIESMVRKYSIKSIIAFDQKVGELLRPVARKNRIGFILVKPGGGQPRLYYPRTCNCITFTQTDRTWLERRAPKGEATVRVAPGRVFEPRQDAAAQAALAEKVKLQPNDLAIIRIGRIHEHYSAVNRAAFNLADLLRKKGFPARLILVGTAQSAQALAELNSLKSEVDAIVTEDMFTNQASRLLSLFRFNVGTGRGFMEGAAVGQILFCASQSAEHKLPLLGTDHNLESFLADNFSPRIKPDLSDADNADRILNLLVDTGRQRAMAATSRSWFEKYFSAETSLKVYSEMIDISAKMPEKFNADTLVSEIHLRVSVLLDRLRNLIH